MYFAYLRVSSVEQNQGRQLEGIKDYCKRESIELNEDNIFLDKQSGKDFTREKYLEMKSKLRGKDVLIVYEMDRLGRNKQMIKEELEWFRTNNIRIIILDIPTTQVNLDKFEEGIAKSMLDMINNVLIEVLSTIAEEERKKIKKRQAEGIAIAKAEGKYKGRKSVSKEDLPKDFGRLYKQWKHDKISAVQFSSLLNLKSRTTLYKYIKIYEGYK
ncbi:recombinase family protein [Clostridium beijerinckii]|uniref:recombinase family protein n=1 Tax=Clostridium beijerinckii TaxID=1520 RepID=UPI001F33ED12|nr:recombinase family protein [Clostridium beijerinckii]